MSDNPVYPAVSTPGFVDVGHGSGKQTAGVQTAPIDPQTNSLPRPSTDSGLAMTGGVTGNPEIKAGPAVNPEVGEIEVIPESPEISPELAEHVEKVVRGEIQLPGPIQVGKHEGEDVTITPFTPQQPNIVLPLTQSDFQLGAKQPVSSAWKWLMEWVKRIILKNPGRAVYRI